MRLTAKDSSVAVVDDIFEPEIFRKFWAYFNSLDFAYRSMTGWVKVWKISDGQVLAGVPSYYSKGPFDSPLEWLRQTVLVLAKQHFEDLVGKEGEDWQDIIFTPYVYPTGTKISWHDDENYTGACIFYPHVSWDPHWGGELMVAKVPALEEIKNLNDYEEDVFKREYLKPLLNAQGMGLYFSPLPNRLVFTHGSAWHCINRVDKSAGDNVRCSIVAFFMKNKIS